MVTNTWRDIQQDIKREKFAMESVRRDMDVLKENIADRLIDLREENKQLRADVTALAERLESIRETNNLWDGT